MRILRVAAAAGRAGAPARRAERRRAASQVKGGGRSEKIRTYNYKENRVTDHRIGLTLHALDRVLAGELDEIVDALAADERARQLGGDRERVASTWRALRAEVARDARAPAASSTPTPKRGGWSRRCRATTPTEWLEIADASAPARGRARLRDMCDRRVARRAAAVRARRVVVPRARPAGRPRAC